MPDSIPDYELTIKTLERRLRAIKRHIMNLGAQRKVACVNDSSWNLFIVHLDEAEERWNSYQSTYEELENLHLMLDQGDGFPTKEWEEHYDSAHTEIMEARALRLAMRPKDDAPGPAAPRLTEDLTQILGALNTGRSDRAHLPKLSIPKFSGDMVQWSSFKDSFSSLIHDNTRMAKVDKLHYLMEAVKGEAHTLICRFPKVEESYDLAWAKLLETYDNPRVMASLYLERILECNCKGNMSEQERFERFLSQVGDSIEALEALKIEKLAEFILSKLALLALDEETRKQFELTLSSHKDIPTAKDVIAFARKRLMVVKLTKDKGSSSGSLASKKSRYREEPKSKYPSRGSTKYNSVALHATDSSAKRQTPNSKSASYGSRFSKTPSARTPPYKPYSPPSKCPYCQGMHILPICIKFASLSLDQRLAFAVTFTGCSNCLREGHPTARCPSNFSCKYCKGRHHSLIHEEKENLPPTPKITPAAKEPEKPQVGGSFSGFQSSHEKPSHSGGLIFLGTVQALIKSPQGKLFPIRAVLDSGSQHTFITAKLARQIGVPAETYSGTVCGIGGNPVLQPAGTATCIIMPYASHKRFKTEVLIVERITSALPNFPAPPNLKEKFASLPLADQEFAKSAPVDALIGSDLYPQLISGAPVRSEVGELFLIPSVFGFVISGKLGSANLAESLVMFSLSSSEIDSKLKMFWEVEEPTAATSRNPEDEACETHFERTHSRTEDGRYMVELPLRDSRIAPSNNVDLAVRRFLALEQKFKKDIKLKESYSKFMQEYIDLGHMSPAPRKADYIIPHHGVWQHRPEGAKLRVVFDASCKSSAYSLNDILYAGPKLQRDLCNILTKFRLYLVPLCTDLVKMYRQILVHPRHRYLQHIYWRASPEEALREFELNTVTYGITSSAYQAIRVVDQLNRDEGRRFPLASSAIRECMYVDDIVSGAGSLEEALELQRQLVCLFSKGGFRLSKWASSFPALIPRGTEDVPSFAIKQENNESFKVLGLVWDPKRDTFRYDVSQPPSEDATKRTILSAVARIFDPLGFLAPVIFLSKSFLQDLWKERLDWDDELPGPLKSSWRELCQEWRWLSSISIPRHISHTGSSSRIVGFCDASAKGYAACLFLRDETPEGKVQTHLLKAKTKVAPTKFLTIARLELCGALLLSRLVSSLTNPDFRLLPPICFTDSQVVISWLCTPTYKLKVFEANRVTAILDVIPLSSWRHVASEDNPADLASRGCHPKKLDQEPLWWHGPAWLSSSVSEWPGTIEPPREDATVVVTLSHDSPKKFSMDEWTSRFSGLNVLVRTVARLLRKPSTSSTRNFSGPIRAEEYRHSLLSCVRAIQHELLPPALYRADAEVPKSYASLSPFVDQSGIVRVGGRLQHAPIDHGAKHPMLVPYESVLARMIVDDIHFKNFHSGPSLTLALLRGRFWVPKASKLIRGRIVRCVPCRVRKAKPKPPLMGSLPKGRFDQYRAFLQVGVDYAGPFAIKESRRRNAAPGKAYLCIFICMATKAVHLEAVSSLSTPAFLDALDRFIARRGTPNTLWSDHGTNFVGASRFLKDLLHFHSSIEDTVVDHLAPKGITWKFIPPRAPNFGGLWEAGVKSVKGLLPQVVGKQPSTFEDLATTFAKIEGLLNSRPLCALKEDPQDFDFLTPGHFLIGSHPTYLSEPYSEDSPTPRSLPSWRTIQLKTAHVWNRWRREYLHTLLQRTKWTRKTPNLKSGDLVILIERRALVGQWPVGRVVETQPGRDGVTRAVVVRTPSGNLLSRAASSLVPLFPPEDEVSQEV